MMQYILTEDEYKTLKGAVTAEKNKLQRTLQSLCTEVANHKPIKFWSNRDAIPWGCILDNDDDWMCDECPVRKLCPYEFKQWSK